MSTPKPKLPVMKAAFPKLPPVTLPPTPPALNPKPTPENPLDSVPEETGNLEDDAMAELMAIKHALQQQDKNQRKQFANLYDGDYYYSDVYPTVEMADYSRKLQQRILNYNPDQIGDGWWRNGRLLIAAYEQLADRLGIGYSDLKHPELNR
ncbi:hypothetical protein ACRQFN_02255 [Actinotignum sp. GS-2025e]|uniref:hypothetical protein n=1 Tax=unclassified Actinotignum TaxID=2632702 RepID=UPI003F47B7B4